MQILVLLGMYFDAVVNGDICHQPDTFIQIGSGHTVRCFGIGSGEQRIKSDFKIVNKF